MAVGLVLKAKKVVVLGANASGVALTKYLIKKGAVVSLADTQAVETLLPVLQEKIDTSKFTLECGEFQPRLFEGANLVIVTPGTPLDLKVLEAARTAGIPVVTELEFSSLFIEEPMVAVGGTKGKTTTAALMTRMLENAGKKPFVNTQHPLSEYLNLSKAADCVVVTASSFQLEGLTNFKPQVVVLLNVHEDHANRYPNFESYIAANREILKNVDAQTTVILNSEDAHVSQWAAQLQPGRILFFGSTELPEGMEGAWYTRTHLNLRFGGVLHAFELKNFRLRGSHNRENLMAASLAALCQGATPEAITQTIETFAALPSRVEFVKRTNAVAFYNDSCAGSVQAVIRTLQSFAEPVILIMGGRDKNADYAPLIPHVRHRVKNLILVGEAKEKINRALGDYTETFLVGTLEEAALMAYQKSRSGDVVLLSPACDSTDVYRDHEDRGEHFKKLVGLMSQPRKIAYI